uniref:Lipoprotein n=1 Tax=Ascaris lumbricoides TaxID=6252 RepID=A0A0M3ILK6_ASCLU
MTYVSVIDVKIFSNYFFFLRFFYLLYSCTIRNEKKRGNSEL